jgi:hypothetical protein
MQTNILPSARSKLALVIGAAALAVFAVSLSAQQYSVNWHKVSGGGGPSSNGSVAINGTIGQHDAGGPMSGGSYSVTGGFWALYAMQTAGAPYLSITNTHTNAVMVYWPYPSAGWDLQVNTNLASTNWTTPPQTVDNNGVINYIIVTPPTGNRFYRLHNP